MSPEQTNDSSMQDASAAAETASVPTVCGPQKTDFVTQTRAAHQTSASLAVIEFDHELRIARWTPKAQHLFGYSVQEAVGRCADLLASSDSREPLSRTIARLAATHGCERATHTVICKNGTLITCTWHLTSLADSEERFSGVVAVAEDVTERVRLDEEMLRNQKSLHRTQEFLIAVINSLPQIFYVFDQEGKCVFWNTTFETVSGRSAREMTQIHCLDHIAPEHRDLFSRSIRSLFDEGTAEAEACILSKQGSRIPHLLTASRAIVGDEVYMVGLGIDVTKENLAKEELRRLEAELRDLYENAPCGYHSLNAAGLVIRMNATELAWLGYTHDEVVGKMNFQELLAPEGVEEFHTAFPALIQTGHARDVEYLMRRKDGSTLRVLVNSSAIIDAAGRFQMSRAMVLDITSREQIESERRLRLLLNSTGQAIYGIDTEGKCSFCNPACVSLLGYDSEKELLGRNMHTLIHYKMPSGAPMPVEQCRIFKAFHSGVSSHADDEYLWRRDGTGFPAEYWSYPQKSGDAIVGAVIAFADITERKRAEGQLRKLNTVVEQNPAAIVITDRDGHIEYVNPKFTEVTGYTINEVHGKTPRIQKTGYTSEAEYQQLWQTILSGHEWRGEFYNRKKDGNYYWERAIIAPVTDAAGAITHFVAVKEDVTAFKRAEEETRRSQEIAKRELAKLSVMVSSMDDGIAFADANDELVEINESLCRLLGCRREEVLGKHLAELRQADIRDAVLQNIEHFHDEIGAPAVVLERTFGHRETIFRMQPIYRNDQYDGLLLNVTDVTELVKSRQQAEAATRAKSMFLAMISHELRTPLNAIIGTASLMLDAELNAEERDGFDTIRSSSEILLGLINEVLDLSKIEADKMQLDSQPFDLACCIKEAVGIVEPMARKKGLPIVQRLAPDLPRMLIGDAPRLRQILVNLLCNAVKFTTAGQITLSVESEPSPPRRRQIHFAVQDTGIGIAPEEQGRLFQAFSQIGPSPTTHIGGTGLGLVIGRRLAELMDGRMWVESTGVPGEGSTFHFTICADQADPFATGGDLQPDMKGLAHPGPLGGSKAELVAAHLHVLLAEDNPINQKVARKMLDKLECRTDVVVNGREAVEAIEHASYDVVLMDCQMPEVNGYEAARRIRLYEQEHSQPPVWIVAMTAAAMKGDREDCIAAGMNDYLSKPVRLRDLEQAFHRYVAAHHDQPST